MIPKLRNNLDFMPATTEQGDQVFIIQDPVGLLSEPVMISQEMAMVLQILESAETIEDLQVTLTRLQGGQIVTKDEIQKIFQELDEKFLLDTETYRKAYQKVLDEYKKEKIRTLTCAEFCYPRDPEELKRQINHALSQAEPPDLKGKLAAIMSPHIDLREGMPSYGKAYRILSEVQQKPKVVVVLGVGHFMDEGYFCVTHKAFETPFGKIETALPLVERFSSLPMPTVTPHDFFHKNEHSIEFQLLFLHHLLGDSFKILPILCGSFHSGLDTCSRASEMKEIQPAIELLKEIHNEYGDDLLFVAGVDLSHVGKKFGDELTAHDIIPYSEEADKKILEKLQACDGPGFWQEIKKVDDKYHICGFSTLSLLLEILPPCKGHLLDYQIWREEPTQSAVSFASMVFEKLE
ncbi:MAG: AmmeMemoRadiSam system protein B [Planctomycetota bacterium]|nr:MAG: AmmeMemoRadiSam system protein B [Planctomycetota bacterium]